MITVTSTEWALWAVAPLAKNICKEAGITWDYKVHLGSYSRVSWRDGQDAWRGTGWKRRQITRVPRRMKRKFPFVKREHRFVNDWSFEIKSRVELLVFVIAHEACHATGSPGTKSGELDCQDAGARAVERYREQRKEWFSFWLAEGRRQRELNRKPTALDKAQDNRTHVVSMLEGWEAKLKRAQKKVREYKRKVSYYDKRIAAMEDK